MSTSNEPRSAQSGRIIHEIQWSEALPWWILFRAAGSAFAPTVILLAALGSLATWAGWSLADRMQLAGADAAANAIIESDLAGKLSGPIMPSPAGDLPGSMRGLMPSERAFPTMHRFLERLQVEQLPAAVSDMLRLVWIPLRPSSTVRQMVGALARIGWFVLVWSIFGTAITRHVALKLVGEEAPGLLGSIWYGTRTWVSSFNAVLFVLVGILALCVPGALLGLLMRTEWGLTLAGAIWPMVLLGAVVLAILAVGLVAGWPLMVSAVGVEKGDSFQAISTAFSFLYQRPLHYAFYGFVALVIALPAFAAAGVFADATSTLALWATSLGLGHDRTLAILEGMNSAGTAAAAKPPWGIGALSFWNRGLVSILSSFGWGYFWAIATAVYVLLRHDVDGTEMDEVVLDEPASDGA
ncbi:MAG: hypothetical protein WCP23_03405 [Planctomycetota bacterium]